MNRYSAMTGFARFSLTVSLLNACSLVYNEAPPAVEAAPDAGLETSDAGPGVDGGLADGGVAGCGDGVVQAGEECDDGNQLDDDACRRDCRSAACGDGVRRTDIEDPQTTGYEACDDGNGDNGDACTTDCEEARCGDGYLWEGLEACDDGNAVDDDGCTNACTEARCGDGIIQGDEICDDGNRDEVDACLNDCSSARCGDGVLRQDLEEGDEGAEACDDGNEVNSDGCLTDCQLARCGDGFVQAGVESCDDGNEDDLDACRNDCRAASCGDGLVQAGEACDDGNDVETDACRSNCQAAQCGDGVRRVDLAPAEVGYEACDDGNEIETDACLSNCLAARCGDGHQGPGEGCDDGNDIDDDDCSNQCQALSCGDGERQAGEACDDGNDNPLDACTNNCARASCGDGFVRADLQPDDDGFEACDDGNGIDQDACTNQCTDARCGDGLVWDGQEACDDGNQVPDDACTNDCQTARCGDRIIQAGEACDDGNADDQDACLSNCQQARCGDGVQRLGPAGEACDDGNAIDGDACTNVCTVAVCGDGVIQRNVEACDDGNRVDDDDCTNSCALPGCGDGILQDAEVCDDGNNDDDDGCRADCGARARCGDGVQRLDLQLGDEGFEACDDGNQSDNDACRNTCRQAVCGDGVRRDDLEVDDEGFEACDDGNGIAADSCLNDCTIASCGDGVRRLDLENWQQGYEACDDGNRDDDDACPNDCLLDDPEPEGEPSFDCPAEAQFNLHNPWYLQAEGSVLWVAPGGVGDGSSQGQPSGNPAAALAALVANGGGTLMLAQGDHVLSASAGAADITIVGACAAETRVSGGTATVITSHGGTLRISGVDLRSTLAVPGVGEARSGVVETSGGHLMLRHVEISAAGGGHGMIVDSGRLTLLDSELGELGGSAVHGMDTVGSWNLQNNSFLGPIGLDGIALVGFGGVGFQAISNTFRSMAGHGVNASEALGSWTVQSNTFLGPIGYDGISMNDFQGSSFLVDNNSFQSVNGRGVYGAEALGSWTVQNNTFLGPIGYDGISIVDFSGSDFRVTDNSFQDLSAYGLQSRDSSGSWTVQDNVFLGPIGLDGIMLNRVGGIGVLQRNRFQEVTGNGLGLLHVGGQEVEAASWTVQSNTFLGPIGYDGISITGFVGASMSISENSVTGVSGRGVLVTGSTATVTMEDNTITDTGGDGVVASGFSSGANLNLNRNDINGASGLAARLSNMGGAVTASSNQFRNTQAREQGGDDIAPASGLGLQATEVRAVTLSNNSFDRNAGGGLVVDLQAWSEVDDLLAEEDEAISLILQDNEVVNEADNLPSFALQNLPDGAQVGGNNQQDADPDLDLERAGASREGCGDGLVRPPETCDDGNLDANDGCGADCTWETGGQIQIALGDRYTCYLNPDAEDPLRCWGDNASGQMGIIPAEGHQGVQAVTVGPANEDWDVLQVAAGDFHLCALAERQEQRRIFCWGRSDFGQTGHTIGEQDCEDTDSWPDEEGEGGGLEGEPCQNDDDCAAGLVCWDGRFCAPGGGDPGGETVLCTPQRSVPVKMENEDILEAVYSVTAGRRHSCALVRLAGRRSVVCWGAYEQQQQGIWPDAFGIFDQNDPEFVPNGGQQGAGMIDTRGHEVYMQGVEPHQLVTGNDFNCVLDVAGRPYCWGVNDRGQLGRGNPNIVDPNAEVDPNELGRVLPVLTEERFQRLAAGRHHVCGVTVHMQILCWGSNTRGQMGRGAPIAVEDEIRWHPQEPVDAPAGAVMSLSAGGGHTVVLDGYERDVPRIWGDNRWNQVGNPDFAEPYSIMGFTTPIMADDRLRSSLVRVGAGERHSCAVDLAGDVVCWGNNEMNQCSAFEGDDRLPEPARLTLP